MSRPVRVTAGALLLASALVVPSLSAQETEQLPPGHPPVGGPEVAPEVAPEGELPPGHPSVEGVPDAPSGEGEMPPGHPSVEGEPPADDGHGHGGSEMDASIERAFREPRVATAVPMPTLPPGQIRVIVVDEHGAPLADHEVQLGVMRQGGDRERTPGRTDAEGVFTYTNLPTGTGQAYRVNVPHEGATYSCTPFQLPTEAGYQVRVEARPTVRSDRSLLLVLGQTMVELRDERLHVIQQARLSNLAAATYLFPEGGTRIDLPAGYTAFQTQPVMTDQRVIELAGEGLRIEGSLPTGQVTLAWAFDVPVTGEEMDLEIPNPFRTFQYRVISTAPPGLHLDVEDMPDPISFDDQGQPLWGTEIQRSPDQPAFGAVRIHLRGIPGPSPVRLYALGIALVFVLLGGFLVARRPANDRGQAHRAARRKQLVDEAAALETQLASGEIGPETRQSRRAAIVRELAVLYYLDERMGTAKTDKPGKADGKGDGPKGDGPKGDGPKGDGGKNDEPAKKKKRAA